MKIFRWFIGILVLFYFFVHTNSVYAAAPSISNLTVSDISNSSAKITWSTNVVATAEVDWGTTSEYGETSYDSNLSTSHSISLSGLSADTTYHYNAESINSIGESTFTGDQTFKTSSSSSSSTTTTTVTKIVTPTSTPTPTPDIVPPSVRITTKVDDPFTISPLIEGTASDVSGVVSAAYSLDEGKTWSPISDLKGGTTVRYSFTPPPLDDGSYTVKVRATDGFGNTGAGKPITIVVDRLPPRVGTTVLTYQSQIITSDSSSVIYAVVGIPYRLFVSAVGGPTTVDLFTTPVGSVPAASAAANFVKNLESGLWSTTLTFTSPGSYTLSTSSVDGAKNQSTRQLINVEVLAAGKVVSANGTALEGAKLTVFYRDTLTKEYHFWDAAPWGLTNPIKSNNNGTYYLVLPEGRYFIEVTHPAYTPARTTQFELTQASPVVTNFTLFARPTLSLGTWQVKIPQLLSRQVTFSPAAAPLASQQSTSNSRQAIGTTIAPFTFYSSDDSISHVSILGKPTLISFLNTWSTHSFEQLPILDTLSNEKSLGAYVIAPFEGSRKVEIFRKRGNYAVPMFADPDGDLAQTVGLSLTPLHVFLDRRGTLRDIKIGVLKMEELRDNLVRN